MKVLVLQSELGVLRGGGENFTRNLFTAFAERGHQVAAAFITDRRGEYPVRLPPSIVPIPIPGSWSVSSLRSTVSLFGRFIPSNRKLTALWDRVQEGVSWRTFMWRRRRFQRAVQAELGSRWNNFDVVYVHGDVTLASWIAQLRPTVLRLPGPVSDELKTMLLSVPAVCANGDALACLRAFLGDHAIELPIGINGQLFRPGSTNVRDALGWTEGNVVTGYVGRLHHLKGVDLLAAAFRELSQIRPDARLLIVGSGEEEGTVRSILAKEIVRGIAHIEPEMDPEQLSLWYRAMDVFVMPSRYENFSNAIIEAMACGLPFLSSDTGGNRTLANTGAGWLFEPKSVLSLGERLRAIIVDRPEMRVRGELGRHYVLGRYSWAASAEQLERVISSRLGVEG
jgi:glycosyltransferase involved in cell wall biosynthesis